MHERVARRDLPLYSSWSTRGGLLGKPYVINMAASLTPRVLLAERPALRSSVCTNLGNDVVPLPFKVCFAANGSSRTWELQGILMHHVDMWGIRGIHGST